MFNILEDIDLLETLKDYHFVPEKNVHNTHVC